MDTRVVFVVGVLLALAAAELPEEHAAAAKAMRHPPYDVEEIPENDDISGVPGSDSLDWPEDLKFGLPCDEMSDEEVIATPVPTPTPTAQLYPEAGDLAFDVVALIRNLCKNCHCGCHNITHAAAFQLATAIWRAMPPTVHLTDVCPSFLAAHPLFPHTATPTPMPIVPVPPIVADPPPTLPEHIRRELARLQNIREQAVTSPGSVAHSDRVETDKRFADYVNMGNDHLTAEDELKRELETSGTDHPNRYPWPPLPEVPTDCGDDLTGSVGLGNDEVSSASGAMNAEYRPAPTVYSPKGEAEPARERELSVNAKSVNDPRFASLLQMPDSDCTEYAAMKATPTDQTPPIDSLHVDEKIECQEACLYEDDCVAWTYGPSHGLKSVKNCELFSGRVVLLPAEPGYRSALCLGPAPVMAPHVHQMLQSHTPPTTTTTTTPPTTTRTEESKLDSNTNWCQRRSTFNAGMGGCETYEAHADHSNFVHCKSDYDGRTRLRAYQACPECGSCEPTPTPTPYIPPPGLATAATLPNGESTPCLAARQAALRETGMGPGMGGYVPQCFQDGSYMPRQCHGDACWCVYTNGVEIPATRSDPNDPDSKPVNCPWKEPSMTPIIPVPPPTPHPDHERQLQAARALAKLMYVHVTPEEFCRPWSNATMESVLVKEVRYNITHPSNFSYCPTDHSVQSMLTALVRCVVKPLERSPSPSPSPSASPSPTVSLSPSPSPSAPIAMCGDVACSERGLAVHIYSTVPQGWCNMCLEGTSGPCRDPTNYACFGYQYGAQCHHTHVKCEDIAENLPPHKTRLDCPPRDGSQVTLSARLILPVAYHTGWEHEWGVTLLSAVSDVVGLRDLCAFRVLKAESAGQSGMRVTVSVSRASADDAKANLAALETATSDGSLYTAMQHRGIRTF